MLYGAALVLRRALAPDPKRVPVPVVCVGNLTTGGTGKTPAVSWVVERLLSLGRKPGILTRGYGRDEPLLLEELCPGVPVVVDPDRAAGAAKGIAGGADVLVMDDGFQNLDIVHDLDLVLVDAMDPWGGGRLLPWGRLREPREALGRAGAVLVTRSDQVAPEELARVREEAARLAPKAILAEAVHRPLGDLGWLKGEKVLAVSGIGNPGAFERALEGLGAVLAGKRRFRDHHPWTFQDVREVSSAAAGATVVTTRKDWVKLRAFPEASAWRTLEIRLEVTRGAEALAGRLGSLPGPAGAPASRTSS